MYDTNKFSERLQELRKDRWKMYKEYAKSVKDGNIEKQKEYERYKKYAFCQSQELLSEKLGIERRSLGRWENGALPSLDNIIEICNVLNCSIDYLLGSSDVPEADPISKAALYSGISSEIIRYGQDNPDYLECLNFFMLPDNCKSTFNSITLSAWRKYWINSILVTIKSPLKEQLKEMFNEYHAITPFNEIKEESYKKFLESKFPKSQTITSQKTPNGIKLNSCFEFSVYQSFLENKELNYERFITYLTKTTFEPLSYSAIIEIQKTKLANVFINLFTKYLEELD